MCNLPFYILDVFAEEKYAGNQLAVVCNADELDAITMQRIAQEMNYSETTFIGSEPTGDGYNVRIFTPAEELPFAGHPTLGTAYIIRRELLKEPVTQVKLNLKVGTIPVTFEEGPHAALWMRQNPPVFGETLDSHGLADALGIDHTQFMDYPIQEVSTGLPFFIAPLKNIAAVKACRIRQDLLWSLTRETKAKAIMVFCPETENPENHLHARVFVDCYGIPEDPATGSANGCLAAYLSRYQFFGENNVNARVEQGYEIDRPSLIMIRAESGNETIRIDVGGYVVMVAKGELL